MKVSRSSLWWPAYLLGAAACFALLASCSSTMPVAATGELEGKVEGRASCVSVLGLTFGCDCSVKRAADAGGVRSVQTVDLHTLNVLGVYQKRTTIVRGE